MGFLSRLFSKPKPSQAVSVSLRNFLDKDIADRKRLMEKYIEVRSFWTDEKILLFLEELQTEIRNRSFNITVHCVQGTGTTKENLDKEIVFRSPRDNYSFHLYSGTHFGLCRNYKQACEEASEIIAKLGVIPDG